MKKSEGQQIQNHDQPVKWAHTGFHPGHRKKKKSWSDHLERALLRSLFVEASSVVFLSILIQSYKKRKLANACRLFFRKASDKSIN